MTRLQEVAMDFIKADEALRKALLRAEKAERINKEMPMQKGFLNPMIGFLIGLLVVGPLIWLLFF